MSPPLKGMSSLFFSFAVSPALTLCKNLQILFLNLFYVKSTPIKSKNMDSKPRLTVFQLPMVTTLQGTAILKLTLLRKISKKLLENIVILYPTLQQNNYSQPSDSMTSSCGFYSHFWALVTVRWGRGWVTPNSQSSLGHNQGVCPSDEVIKSVFGALLHKHQCSCSPLQLKATSK